MIERGHIGRALQIVATHPFEYLVAGLVLGGLVVATLGLLVGPAAGGVIAMTLKRCRNEDIDIADAFRGFENFTTTFLVGLAYVGMVAFGSIFLLLPGIVLAGLFAFSLPIAVDRPVGPGEALKQARILAAQDLFAHSIFAFVAGIIAFSGSVFLLVGLCLSVPVALASITVAYHDAAYPSETAAGVEAG